MYQVQWHFMERGEHTERLFGHDGDVWFGVYCGRELWQGTSSNCMSVMYL